MTKTGKITGLHWCSAVNCSSKNYGTNHQAFFTFSWMLKGKKLLFAQSALASKVSAHIFSGSPIFFDSHKIEY
jgi:hypothetical protein